MPAKAGIQKNDEERNLQSFTSMSPFEITAVVEFFRKLIRVSEKSSKISGTGFAGMQGNLKAFRSELPVLQFLKG
jgi:hypothetical protein